MQKKNCKGKEHNKIPRNPLGERSSKFTSPEQFFAAALHQDMQHQQPQALKTGGKSVQQHLPQQEFQRTDRSVQAPSSSEKVTTVVQQIMAELSEAVSEDKIMAITKMVLNENRIAVKEFIGRSELQDLMQMAFGGSTLSSVNNCKVR
jgi:hypothetical protein